MGEEDYEVAAMLVNRVCPDRLENPAEWRQEDGRDASERRALRRYVAMDAGTQSVIGYAAAVRTLRDDRYFLDIVVQPDRRGQGVGTKLVEKVVGDLRAEGATTLQARMPEDRPEDSTFFQKRGFIETQRMHRLRLDLADADLPALLPLMGRAASFRYAARQKNSASSLGEAPAGVYC